MGQKAPHRPRISRPPLTGCWPIKLSGVNLVSVNMSFGSPGGFNDATDPEQIAIRNCRNNGIFISLSAGNEYYSAYPYNQVTWSGEDPNKLSYYPADIGIVGGPSVASGPVSIAASWNGGNFYFSFLVNDGSSTRGAYTPPRRSTRSPASARPRRASSMSVTAMTTPTTPARTSPGRSP